MKIRFMNPGVLLQPYIECYWSWESDSSKCGPHHLPRVIPSTNMEMILFYKKPFSILDRKGEGHRLPQSHFVFWMREAYSLSLPKEEEIGFVAIRFRPGCFAHFYKGTMDELIEPFLPIPDVWGASGVELTERVMEAVDMEERIRWIETFR